MENTEFKKWLEAERACGPATEWAATLKYDPARVYAGCHRGDWLLWWATRCNIDRKVLVKAAVECAALALPYTDDQRVHHCIAVTRRWCEGLATDVELRDAAEAAEAATWAARAAGAAAGAARAARAAWAAWAAAWAAEAAGEDTQKRTADVVRQHIPLGMLVNTK